MNDAKFADSSACSSAIDPELSITNRMSTSLLMATDTDSSPSPSFSYCTSLSG
jgi:hypothetical protein